MIGSHIIPRFYLEQFATPSKRGKAKPGRIWVYEKDKEPSERATSVQGVENGYFAYVGPDGFLEESLESVLAARERECNDVLVCAKSDLFHWPHGSEDKLAFYAALLYSRATQRRDFNRKNYTESLAQLKEATKDEVLIQELAEGLGRRLGIAPNKETVRNAINLWLKEAQDATAAKNAFLSDVLSNADLIANVLLTKRPWRVLRSTDEEFVTSDNPLITFVPLGNGKLHPGYGFSRPEAVAAFPLAPHACLIMGDAWNASSVLNQTTLREVNETLISISDRYVYSRSLSPEMQEMVQRYAGTARYGVTAFMPLGIKLPNARQILRTHFGLPPE